MEQNLWRQFRAEDVQFLGLDVYNGSTQQLAAFRGVTGITFPLLLRAANGTNYGADREDLMVVDKGGTVRQIAHVFSADQVSETIRKLLADSPPNETPAGLREDFDGNGRVDFPDFLAFARAFNSVDSAFDLDASGRVDFGDFLVFARAFGKSAR